MAAASATAGPAADAAVRAVLLHRVAAAVDDGDGDLDALRRRGVEDPRAELARPLEFRLAVGGRRVGHAQAVLGDDRQLAEALLPAGLVVAVLADVGHPERVRDEQVLGIRRRAVGADDPRVDAGRGRTG